MPSKPPPSIEPTTRQPAPEIGPRAQRTISKILEASREIFITRGYGGAAIDDITTLAGVSRASFYTYFPTKRDALLEIGRRSTAAGYESIELLKELPPDFTAEDLEGWIRSHLDFVGSLGSIGIAWGQAAHTDDELRELGKQAHLHISRSLGAELNRLRGEPLVADTEFGLLVFSMLERTWTQHQLYERTLSSDAIVRAAAQVLIQLLAT